MRIHLRLLFGLLVINLIVFHDLVRNPNHVLYSDHSDFLAEHIPAKRFLVRSFQQTGELPLWCPYQFAGSPFVHDIQVAMFYPPHLALLLMPEEAVGQALSWNVVLHVLLAGWLMYGYAWHRGLSYAPCVVAASGFMFGGRWLMHLIDGGHYILIGLAWLPLVLLAWEKVVAGNNWLWGLLAGCAFAMLTLATQPQWTFYSGIFAGLWTLGAVREHRHFGRWVCCGLLIVVVSVALTAIQLLPTLEAAGQSSRAGGVGAEGILAGGLRVLLFLVGPPLSDEPFNLQWEDRGGLAVLWLIAVGWAVILDRGRTRYEAGVTLGLFVFAMGGAVLFQPLPGFNLFRQPARMAVVATFPIAWLGARGFAALLNAPLSDAQRKACRRWFVLVVIGTLILVGGFALRCRLEGRAMLTPVYYFCVPILLIVGWFALAHWPKVWMVLLGTDLAVMGAYLVQTWPAFNTELSPRSVQYVAHRREKRERVFDVGNSRNGQFLGTPLGSGAPLALIKEIDPVRGYSPLDVRRYREFLAMIADEPLPLRALDSTLSYPVIGEFPLVNRAPLDLLGVRWLLLPADQKPPGENWREVGPDHIGAYYDFIAGGAHELGKYIVWENMTVLPRAFVVPQGRPLARKDLLETFKKASFRSTVYLEDFVENFDEPSEQRPLVQHDVNIRTYQPNRVILESNGQTPGFLVLADVWYPGWKCTIDGEETKVYRANYCFRAVKLPAGAHTIEFRFEPQSYQRGRTITLASLGGVAFLALVGGLMAFRSRRIS